MSTIDKNTRVVRQGKQLRLQEIDQVDNVLPVGHYSLGFDMQANQHFLTQRKEFKIPPKVYGDPQKDVTRCLKAFNAKSDGMGILLSGEKGAGKTMMAKMMANQANMPVILMESNFSGPVLTEFIEQIPCDCMFFVDEFEKIYGNGMRTAQGNSANDYFLTLLDGTAANRHLFILTSNLNDIGDYFMSRPGRIRYHYEFNGISEDIIEEAIEDMVNDPNLVQAVKDTVATITNLNFDSLMSIIEEVNLMGEEPKKFMRFFNVRPDLNVKFDVSYTRSEFRLNPEFVKEDERTLAKHFMRQYQELKALTDSDEIEDFHQYRPEYLETANKWAEHIAQIDVEYTTSYVSIFGDNDGAGKYPSVYVNSLTEDDEQVSFSDRKRTRLNWDGSTIDKIQQQGKTMIIHNKNGEKLIAKPSSTYRSTYGGGGSWD